MRSCQGRQRVVCVRRAGGTWGAPGLLRRPAQRRCVLIYADHVHWMRIPKKSGGEKAGAAHRRLRRQDLEPYRGQFQLLLDSSRQAPWQIPDHLLEAVAAVGGPPGAGLPQRFRQRRAKPRTPLSGRHPPGTDGGAASPCRLLAVVQWPGSAVARKWRPLSSAAVARIRLLITHHRVRVKKPPVSAWRRAAAAGW
jgi:hypothetical protein